MKIKIYVDNVDYVYGFIDGVALALVSICLFFALKNFIKLLVLKLER